MNLLTDPSFITVLAGTTVLGVVGGVVGCFTLLRRQSLLGDALAHAALPGVCVAFILTGEKQQVPLLVGALLAGIVGALFILVVVRGSRIKEDSAIGIVLSVFFGVGIVLLTWIQKRGGGDQSGLDSFLFGQPVFLVHRDVMVFAVTGLVVLGLVVLFYKELKLLCFDRAFGATLGFPMSILEIGLTCLLVVVVVIGLQTVGVVLMVAALITPAAAARQWTDRFGIMMLLSGGIAAFASAVGVVWSGSVQRIPTGPAIVVVASCVLVASILAAPHRGMLWERLRSSRMARRIRRENLLKDMYLWGERLGSWERPVSLGALMGVRGQSNHEVRRTARRLRESALIETLGDQLRLTTSGFAAAERIVRKHRLWELYLARRLELPPDHVHRDAEAMEHALTDEAVEEFESLLGYPVVDPHGQAIPPRRSE